jgi:hypothetical protein
MLAAFTAHTDGGRRLSRATGTQRRARDPRLGAPLFGERMSLGEGRSTQTRRLASEETVCGYEC